MGNKTKVSLLALSLFFSFSTIVKAKESLAGYYGGLELGVQRNSTTWQADYLNTAYAGEVPFDSTANSKLKSHHVVYGGFLGKNWVADQYIYGLEFKVNAGQATSDLAGIPGCAINCDGYTAGRDIDRTSVKFGKGVSVNGKLGIYTQDGLATYGIAGVAYQKITTSATCQESAPDPVCLVQDGNPYSTRVHAKNLFGLSLGAGVEKLFGAYSVRAEYLYTRFNKTSTRAVFDEGTIYDYSVRPSKQVLNIGVSYHF